MRLHNGEVDSSAVTNLTASQVTNHLFMDPAPVSPSALFEQQETDVHSQWFVPATSISSTDMCRDGTRVYDNFLDLPFIKRPELGQLSTSDMAFLQSNGCFDLLSAAMMGEFIRLYFLYIHPIVPLLDEAQFWSAYLQEDSDDKLPLLTVQAMLFAASSVSAIWVNR